MLSVAACGVYAASATSPVFGVYKVDCPADSDTYIGIPSTRAPEFSGVVEGAWLEEAFCVSMVNIEEEFYGL